MVVRKKAPPKPVKKAAVIEKMGDSYTPRLELAVDAFVDCCDIVPASTSEKVRVARMKQEWLDRLGLSRVIRPKGDEDAKGDDGADEGW